MRVHGKIARPVAEVFDTVYNPGKLSGYFTTGGASGPLDEGTTVMGDFADFPGAFPVKVRKVVPGRLIELAWKAADESGWRETSEGLKSVRASTSPGPLRRCRPRHPLVPPCKSPPPSSS